MVQIVENAAATISVQAAQSKLTIEETVNKQKRRRNILSFPLNKRQVEPLFTFFYPYVFWEWKVTVPRFVFRDGKALIRIGVNGLTNVAAQTEIWPDFEKVQIEEQHRLPFRITEKSADEECKRALENYVYKSMRPLKPPVYKLNRKEKIYLPYHVYLELVSDKKMLMVTEALTGVTAEARKMKEIREWLIKMAREYS